MCLQMLYSHNQLYLHICMQKPKVAMKMSGHRSLEKYTSHFIERVVCERELETEQNCNILTSTFIAITAFLSRSPGLLAWGPSLSGAWSSFQHLLSNSSKALNSNCSIRGPEGPLCWVLVLSTAPYLQLIWTSCLRGYIILNSTSRQSRSPLTSWHLRPDAPIINTGAFLLLTAWPGRRLIYNTNLVYLL